MEAAENRFAQLLKPIRELTENWEVDLVAQLGDYLQELEEVQISFDGGKTTMNFAEAALLLQGTTSIYGKKVELLHRLVFQTLDYISNKNKKKDKVAEAAEGGDAGEEESASDEVEEQFQAQQLIEEDIVTSENQTTLHTQPSTVLDIAPIPPSALIPLDALEKQEFPLLNTKGEVLGSWKDFRINVFPMGREGELRLGLEAFHSYFLQLCSTMDPDADADIGPPLHIMDFHMGQGDVGAAAGEGEAGIVVGPEVEGQPEDGGVGGASGFMPLEDHGPEVDMGMDADVDEHIERHQSVSDRRMLRERAAIKPVAAETQSQKEVVDVWKWHDLYTAVGEDKPVATGRCCNVPPGLDESGKRKRKGSSKLEEFGTWWSKTNKTSERKLKNGPSIPELNYIYQSKMKERVRANRNHLRTRGVVVSEEQLIRTYLEVEEEPVEQEEPEEMRHQGLDGDDDGPDGGDDFVLNFSPEEEGGDRQEALPDMPMEDLSYEDMVKRSMDQFFANAEHYARVTALSTRVQDWEKQIKPHLAAEEERGVYDIREYGDHIITAFSQVKEKRTFASIVAGKNNHEVCRYMLACLQLANDATVEISKEGKTLEETVDSMTLTLLSERRAHDRLKAYSTNAGLEAQVHAAAAEMQV
ncbi:condensin-2 complex subunit H2 isoform X2 [Engraulis encrasicolus]|uniref:condensin-2 complex subunit H2 isoform X2 n=1 Tax=Engraulis encrasicolus TaxID=184585 RepID=UPI002FCF5009